MLASALILGLIGSFHCVGMCGPIAFLLPIDRQNNSRRIFQLASYHTGRLFTYALIGLLFGVLGKSLNLFGFQQYISIAIGVLMILVVILPTQWVQKMRFTKPIYRLVGKVKSALGQELKKRTPGTFFTIGFLNGLLPCGLVYMAVFGAIASGNALHGSLYMVVFGLGTVPLMTTATYLGNFLTGKVRRHILKVIPVMVVLIGLLFILRGLGLSIPYISPSPNVQYEEVSADQSCH